MANFIDPITKAIDKATDYDTLASGMEHQIIKQNLIEHVVPNLLSAIDRIGANSSYYRFLEKLVVCAGVSNHTVTCQSILSYLCNVLAKNFDSLQYEPDSFTLLIMVICCDDKSFVKKMSLEQKTAFSYAVMKYLDGQELPELTPGKIGANGTVMSILLDCAVDGNSTAYLEEEIQKYSASDWVHPEWLNPYISWLINICSGLEKESLLYKISESIWKDMMEDRVTSLAHLLCNDKGLGIDVDPFWVRGLIWDFLVTFGVFREKIANTGYTQIACEPVGILINTLKEAIRCAYDHIGIQNRDAIAKILLNSYQLYQYGYPTEGNHSKLIEFVVNQYCLTGKYEEGWKEGEFLKAQKLAFEVDENFDELKRYFQNWDIDPSVVKSFDEMSKAYEDPVYEAALLLLPAEEAKKPERWTYDEEEDESQQDASENPDSEDEGQNTQRKDPGYDIEASQSTKGYHKGSKTVQNGTTKIYKAFKAYKNNEAKVDSQIDKMIQSAKKAFTPDKTEQIINGKRFTPIGLLKKCLLTAGIFSWSKIGGIIYIVVSHTLAKNRTDRERKEIIVQLEEEIKILDEKIDDARGDGNRQAKYALMRTRAELKNALDKIRFKTSATKTDLKTAVNYIRHPARAFDRGGRREDEQY